jgi:biotin carboxyl carrier protein
MPYEVKIDKRSAHVELLSRKGNQVLIVVDGKEYQLDIEKVARGKYSILYDHKSFNVEIIPGTDIKQFVAHTFKNTYQVDIIDAEAKYLANRLKGREDEGESTIVAPIPGRVVKILVEKGDLVQAGQTVIIISAMKMESEFKARKQGKVIDIPVAEGQTVDARQVLVVIEDAIEQQ